MLFHPVLTEELTSPAIRRDRNMEDSADWQVGCVPNLQNGTAHSGLDPPASTYKGQSSINMCTGQFDLGILQLRFSSQTILDCVKLTVYAN